ncbi:MAG: hypothetical protein ACU843_06810 [Gammaproteobacteria bacterium]
MKFTPSCVACATILSLSISNAVAGDFLKCERRLNPPRSKASVEAQDLVPGAVYSVTLYSAGGSAVALEAADVAGKVESDFDSNPNDVMAGATAIAPNFIGNNASASVKNAMGTVVASGRAACVVK